MKELGSRVTFVRRNSATKVTLAYTCSDMKVWSCTFAMNVQRASTRDVNWNTTRSHTLASDVIVAVYAAKISSVVGMLKNTSGNVLTVSYLTIFCEHVSESLSEHQCWERVFYYFIEIDSSVILHDGSREWRECWKLNNKRCIHTCHSCLYAIALWGPDCTFGFLSRFRFRRLSVAFIFGKISDFSHELFILGTFQWSCDQFLLAFTLKYRLLIFWKMKQRTITDWITEMFQTKKNRDWRQKLEKAN